MKSFFNLKLSDVKRFVLINKQNLEGKNKNQKPFWALGWPSTIGPTGQRHVTTCVMLTGPCLGVTTGPTCRYGPARSIAGLCGG
jgi:hypothetical protein